MKKILLVFVSLFASVSLFSQCPGSCVDVTIDNVADGGETICITSDYTGTITFNGGDVCVAPGVTWTSTTDISLSSGNLTIHGTLTGSNLTVSSFSAFLINNGTINMNAKVLAQNFSFLTNNGTINCLDFENDGSFVNNNISAILNVSHQFYNRGELTNYETINVDCSSGLGTCEFRNEPVGGQDLNNQGLINVNADGLFNGAFTGSGEYVFADPSKEVSFDWTGGTYTGSDKFNIAGDLRFGSISQVNGGNFTVDGYSDCGGVSFSGTICDTGNPTHDFDAACASSGYTIECTLPVELLDFSHEASEESLQFYWITADERGVSHYELEMETETGEFEMVDMVWSDNHTNIHEYASATISRPYETSRFRLRMVDIDGSTDFSRMIEIKGKTRTNDFRIGHANLRKHFHFFTDHNTAQTLNVYTLDGRKVQSYQVNSAGRHLLKLKHRHRFLVFELVSPYGRQIRKIAV
ncbi:MAG: hypothetical protein AAF206_10840 [Bacteroidota bacterium]